jgi:hypothetical protein
MRLTTACLRACVFVFETWSSFDDYVCKISCNSNRDEPINQRK